LFRDKRVIQDQSIELGTTDVEATAAAVERLPLVASIIGAPLVTQQPFNVFINIDNTPEGISAAQALLFSLGRNAMTAPSAVKSPTAGDRPPIAFMPTAGGMALGLVGGIGLGMALTALRETANATGNPLLGSLAIGLGLLGTAIGGAAGAAGALPKIKFSGLELSFEK